LELMLVFLACRYLSLVIYSFFLSKRIERLAAHVDFTFIWNFLKKLQTFVLIIVFVTIYWRLDIIMLTKMDGTVASGIYSAAYRLFQIFIIIPQSFVYSLFPIISKKFGGEGQSFQETVERGVRYLLFFSIPMTVLMIVLAKPVIFLLYGQKFSESIAVLKILMLTIIPYSITVMMGYTLVASNLQKYDMIINGSSVVVNATLNYFLISRWGYNGAAAATFLSICFYLIFQYPIVRKYLFHIHFSKYIVKPLLASVLVGLLLFYLIHWNVFLNIGIGIVFYLALLYILSYYDREEKLYFKQLVLALKRPQ
ncbi:MAG: oligosaccharide flippase family protein, partial [Calditrichaeota bacterium]|nr:oligosaccharide flippase family protein [Calditrichota bacterium]